MLSQHLFSSLVVFALGLTFAVPAAAHGSDRRQARQQARIGQGMASGELTAAETARLLRQQRRVRRVERRVEADGVVTRREARRLDRVQDRAGFAIARKKHNRHAR
jgi:hypothetical protein